MVGRDALRGKAQTVLGPVDPATLLGSASRRRGSYSSIMSARPPNAPKLIPPPTYLSSVVRSGVMPILFCWPPLDMRLVMISSKINNAPAGTFNNNLLTMAAGVVELTQLFKPAVADALFASGEALRARLNLLSQNFAMRRSGLGSLMTVHFQANGPARAADIVPDSARRSCSSSKCSGAVPTWPVAARSRSVSRLAIVNATHSVRRWKISSSVINRRCPGFEIQDGNGSG
jgi:hypothetical protein